MTKTTLPPELTALIEYVELNRADWWEDCLGRVIVVCLWLANKDLTGPDIVDEVSRTLGAPVPSDRVESRLEALLERSALVNPTQSTYRVSQAAARVLDNELETVLLSEDRAKQRLYSVVSGLGIECNEDDLWRDFEELYLLPLISQSGARTYELATGRTTELPSYPEVVNRISDKYGELIRDALVSFIDPDNPDVRDFILRRMNANYATEWLSLSDATLQRISTGAQNIRELRIFVDTNFLFSILGLHDNPSNSVAMDLEVLIKQVQPHLEVTLYVLPISIDELRRVLRRMISQLSDIRPVRTVASAASHMRSSGLVQRFLTEASTAPNHLTADDFFGPYESDPVTILRERGVELFNSALEDQLRTNQQVLDDLLEQQAVQARVRARGAKPYEANLHDMVLWHLVRRLRNTGRSQVEVDAWIATVDFGLISFDRHKRDPGSVPVCMTPSGLMQVLRFWAPRSEEMDRALVGSVREPLLFLPFDGKTEAVTLRILRKISRFEHIGDLSEETIGAVLVNEALRSAISNAESEDDDLALIESATVDVLKGMESQLAETVAQAEQKRAADSAAQAKLKADLESARGAIQQTDADRDRLAKELTAYEAAIGDEVAARESAQAERDGIAEVLTGLQEEVASLHQHGARSRRHNKRLIVAVAALASLSALTFLVRLMWDGAQDWMPKPWLGRSILVLGAVFLWGSILEMCTYALEKDDGRRSRRVIHRGGVVLGSACVTVALGVLGNVVFVSLTE